ncbi:hypothetical protein HanOQP8_Chr02g0082921 [Helianthus annuus]|nr:hypothetical protein HanHA89_Chr02g0078181 [Helianthus annuus]KAJ0787478.1 hypothetical protein HanOQP8_Chr02g0082921 [Helianthus annuus]
MTRMNTTPLACLVNPTRRWVSPTLHRRKRTLHGSATATAAASASFATAHRPTPITKP